MNEIIDQTSLITIVKNYLYIVMERGDNLNKILEGRDVVFDLRTGTKDSAQSVGSVVLLSRNCSLEALERVDTQTTMA